ncbi:MAG: hypothetical protein SGJ02_09480, partial [bacterium]|nr:hypothetical protein [bacterium]
MKKDSYIGNITKKMQGNSIWQNFKYDKNGLLWLDGVCLMDLINRYDTPLQINYMPILSEKGNYLKKIVQDVANKADYSGGFKFLYATKANMRAWYITEASTIGWDIETSSNQDLINIQYLINQKSIREDVTIVCNGLKKLNNSTHDELAVTHKIHSGSEVVFIDPISSRSESSTDSYSENIVKLHNNGINIIPILDQDELEYFAAQHFTKKLQVGLRMKFGKVTNEADLGNYVSRHGLSWNQVCSSAQDIEDAEQLELAILHAMPGVSADAMSEEKFSHSLLFAVDHYFRLKSMHPSLSTLNIGGGLPPTLRGFNYEKFLSTFLKEVKVIAKKYNLAEPTIMFELG